MRILWVASHLEGRGGIGHVVASGARALAARGHEVHVAGPASAGDRAAFEGLAAHAWPRHGPRIARLPALLALARRLAPDVVHFHAARPHPEWIGAARLLRGAIGRPLLALTPHGSRPWPRRARLAVRSADLVVVPSAWAAEAPRAAGARSIEVAPGGVAIGAAPDLDARDPAVLVLARLAASKGIAALLDAFDAIAAARPAWELWIAGDGPDRDALMRRAAALGCTARVRFGGWVDGAEKERLLARAAIGVLPTLRESFGGALLEMQARGLACIASDVGGLAELAANGAARLVAPGDPRALAAALAETIDDTALRRALAGRGRRNAERFDWSAIAARYESIYLGARNR
jgi:glycosyltransferase involved in cell wall biosynthesis